MLIKQFKYAADNLGYLVYADGYGIAIDPGDPEGILSFAADHQIQIQIVTNTHTHGDHTSGNQALLDQTGAQFFDCTQVKTDQKLVMGNEQLIVFPTPGHTTDSVCFAGNGFLVTGDTLFNGTVGNCFSGDLKSFFQSLKRLMDYPETTQIFAGHDYVDESMKYARIIEKDNVCIDAFLDRYAPELVVSTLGDELKVNPYIRFNALEMIDILKSKNEYSDSEFERFQRIMELY